MSLEQLKERNVVCIVFFMEWFGSVKKNKLGITYIVISVIIVSVYDCSI